MLDTTFHENSRLQQSVTEMFGLEKCVLKMFDRVGRQVAITFDLVVAVEKKAERLSNIPRIW